MTTIDAMIDKQALIDAYKGEQGDVQTKTFFANGYGVSVIRHLGSYGYNSGLFELAVLKGTPSKYDLCYTTPITGDVCGYLTPEEVVELTEQVSQL